MATPTVKLLSNVLQIPRDMLEKRFFGNTLPLSRPLLTIFWEGGSSQKLRKTMRYMSRLTDIEHKEDRGLATYLQNQRICYFILSTRIVRTNTFGLAALVDLQRNRLDARYSARVRFGGVKNRAVFPDGNRERISRQRNI